MSRLKVLFITKDHAQQVEKSSYYLSKELAKKTDLIQWHQNGHIQSILNQMTFRPDFILLNDFKPDYCPFIRGLRSVNIPVGVIFHDLQYKPSGRRRFIAKENIRYIFTIYRDPFLRMYPEFADRMIWFPHHVPLETFKDFHQPRIINWLMTGMMIPRLYPLRCQMLSAMAREQGFVHHSHPGYRRVNARNKKFLAGDSYAKEINRAKMVLTCDSTYHFPVLKYFETAACNTLLLAPASKELSDLGFIDGKTFAAVNADNFKRKAYYYLNNEKERKEIAKNGCEMVRKRHSTAKRAEELLEKITQIVAK